MSSILLLVVFLLIELGLFVTTLIKKQNKVTWRRNRFLANALDLVTFLIFTLFPGVDFSFRFKGLLILLVIRILIAGALWFLKRNKTGRKHPLPAAIQGALAMMVLSLFMIPAFIFADYQGREVTGSYEIATTEAILVDESRVETFETDGSKREVPVHFYYPADAAEDELFPLVLFSHGAFGYYQSNTSTYMELASQGYVVVSLDHPYHSFFCKDTDGKIVTVNPDFLNEVMYVNDAVASEEEILELSAKWLKLRTDDISFVLDSIEKYTGESYNKEETGWSPMDAKGVNAGAENYLEDCWKTIHPAALIQALDHVDIRHIGLMGHSLGGAASVELGRTRRDVDAVIDLDGTMLSEQLSLEPSETYEFEGKTYHEKYVINQESYPVPLFAIDSVLHHESRENATAIGMPYANTIVLEHAMEGYDTYILDTAHMNFTDLPLFAPILGQMLGTGTVDAGECVDTMNQLMLSFFNAKLKGMGTFTVQECY